MSNNIIRTFHRLLSLDTSANDLTGTPLANKKAEIIANYPDLDPALFDTAYWDAQKWHYTSLKTLLGDLSSNWVKNKFYYFSHDANNDERPVITFSDRNEIVSRGSSTYYEGTFTIQVIADSNLDNAKCENIASRIIQVLGDQVQVPDAITVPNNIRSLNYVYQGSTTGTNNFDIVTISYNYDASFIGL